MTEERYDHLLYPKNGVAAPEINADELAMLCKALAHPARAQPLSHLSTTQIASVATIDCSDPCGLIKKNA